MHQGQICETSSENVASLFKQEPVLFLASVCVWEGLVQGRVGGEEVALQTLYIHVTFVASGQGLHSLLYILIF